MTVINGETQQQEDNIKEMSMPCQIILKLDEINLNTFFLKLNDDLQFHEIKTKQQTKKFERLMRGPLH